MGPDELRARQLLLDMQERLGRDPFEALGLNSSDPGEVRTAFLALTKIYHPARFARMPTEIQRLSNEVFLSMRAAHDALVRPQVKLPAPRATGMIPIVRPPPPAAGRPPSGAMPALRPTPTTPARTMTPPLENPIQPRPQSPQTQATQPMRPNAPRTMTPTLGNPIQPRPHNPQSPPSPQTQATQPIRPNAPRTMTSTLGNPSQPRPHNPQSPQTQATQPMRPVGTADPARPSRLPTSSPPPSTISPGSGRSAPPPARPSGSTPVVSTGDAELAAIHELLSQDRLTDARMKLETLVARQPNVPGYQALIHYAKGREAQLAGRRDEARLELLDALDLDRDLQMANTALSELLSRRK